MFGQIRPAVKNLLTVANSWLADQTYTTQRKAISAATVQTSASQIWEGSAWSSNTATPVPVSFKAFTQGVTGSPGYGIWRLQYSLNNAAYTNAITWDAKGAASSKPLTTLTGYAKIDSDNSSTIDTLQSLNVSSSGNQNHIVMSFGATIRSGWSVNTAGTTEYKTAGASPFHNFNVGSSITSQTLIAQIYSSGFYNSYSNFNAGKVTAGNADQSVQTTLSSYGSLAVKGTLVTNSSYTLAETETFVYVDPSQANVCTGTPATCISVLTESPCNARSGVGCSWFAGNSCNDQSNTNESSCEDGRTGCTWVQVSCSAADNTDQSTCESQDDAYGGNCSWDTSTCPAYVLISTCQAESGCTANTSSCSGFNGSSEGTCEFNGECVWTGGDCTSFSGTDQSTCESGHTGCTWNAGPDTCTGVYDEGSTCAGDYLTSCSGNLCNGDFNNGVCSGTYGAYCQGTANCNNLTDDGSTACNAESGCAWTVGITVTLPTTANANRNGTGRIYSILHVGETGTVQIVGQSGQPIFQYTTLPLLKKGDKVLLHNQNITFQCSLFATQTPCQAQTGCTWQTTVVCSGLGDESSCNAQSGCGCSWDGMACSGTGCTTGCLGTYSNGAHWYAHSLERGLNYQSKTANYTLTDIDDVIDCTSGTFTLTLPSAALNNGKTFYLKNTGSGTITLNTTSSQTIDGNASGTLTLTTGDSMTVISNNSNWVIV